MFKNTVLNKKVKIDFLGEKCHFDQKLRFLRMLAEDFGAKTTHFDVIVIRKMIFQALTKNF